MNDRVMTLYARSGYSKYALAKRSGLPYTTVCEVLNGKLNINKCSFETVYKLAIGLETDISELINDFNCLDGVEREYRSIKYRWFFDGSYNGIIYKRNGDEEIRHNIDIAISPVGNTDIYEKCAELILDSYIRSCEFEESVSRFLKVD